ncbi:MAG TPA: aldolase/citrate lyase family protein [Casimicrobiaceae bacterium]|nr:aldolase/citrate lyase family protein [Casimicrobiaceae bacterium]
MNKLRDLVTRSPAFGTWTQIADAEIIDMLAAAGFGFTIIDAEHGALDMGTVQSLVRACDANAMVPLVRVPDNDRVWIGKSLDAGAAGVIVPGIASVEAARNAVAASRFGPPGTRGACPGVRAGAHYVTDWCGYVAAQHRDTGVILLIETPQAVADIDEIAALEGLLGLLVGPFDLSVSMGHQGDYMHRDVIAGIDRVIAAARAHNLPMIVPVFSADPAEGRRQVEAWRAKGVEIFTVGTDKILIAAQFARYRAALS